MLARKIFKCITSTLGISSKVKIFLSHDGEDRDLGDVAYSFLISNFKNLAIFFTSHPPSGVPSGQGWFNGIVASLVDSEIILALITDKSENSTWVHLECGAGLEKEKTIPIFYKPDLKTPLTNLQGHFLTEKSINHLLNILKDKGAVPIQSSWDRMDSFIEQSQLLIGKKEAKSNKIANQLSYFMELVDTGSWKHINDEDGELFICEQDELYQIKILNREEDSKFSEEWSTKFPDKYGSQKEYVQLLVSGTPIEKKLLFATVDGFRIFIPMPEIGLENPTFDEPLYYYVKDSIPYRLSKVIGRYGAFDSIEDVASHAGIKIINSNNELPEILKKERPLRIRGKSEYIKIIREFGNNRPSFKLHFFLALLNVSDSPISLHKLDIALIPNKMEGNPQVLSFGLDEYAIQKETAKYNKIKDKPLVVNSNELVQVWFLCPGGSDSDEKMTKVQSVGFRLNLFFTDGLGKRHSFMGIG